MRLMLKMRAKNPTKEDFAMLRKGQIPYHKTALKEQKQALDAHKTALKEQKQALDDHKRALEKAKRCLKRK